MIMVLTSWVVMSGRWNHVHKAHGEYLLNGRLGKSWFPNRAASHPGGAKVKSLGCCAIFSFQSKHSAICWTLHELPGQDSSCHSRVSYIPFDDFPSLWSWSLTVTLIKSKYQQNEYGTGTDWWSPSVSSRLEELCSAQQAHTFLWCTLVII